MRLRGAGPAGAAATGAPGPGAPRCSAPPRAAAAGPQPGGEGDGGRSAQVSREGAWVGVSGPSGAAISQWLLCFVLSAPGPGSWRTPSNDLGSLFVKGI